MMTQTAFEDFFKRGLAELPKPKSLPRGHYVLALRGNFKRPPREEGKSGQITLFYEPVEPCDDVDPNELEAFSEGGRSIKDNVVTVEFWLGDWKDVKNVFDHLSLLGVDVEGVADLSVALKAATNKRTVAYVSPDTYMHKVKGMQTKDKAEGFKAIQ